MTDNLKLTKTKKKKKLIAFSIPKNFKNTIDRVIKGLLLVGVC